MGRKREKPNPSIEEEEEKRRKKKIGQSLPLPLPLPATSEEEEEFCRNWSGLPELALHSIFSRLVSIPDLLSFSSVCRYWNSLSSSSSISFPPLFLLPDLNLQNPNPSCILRACRPTWSHPRLCRLQTLETLGRSFQSKIPSQTIAHPFLGYSNGHLIFRSSSSSNSPFLLLANVFSGQTTRIPFPFPFPSLSPFPNIALLTDTDLLLASNSLILSYHRATASWSQLNHGAASLAASSRDSNQLFSIDRDAANLRVIQFTPASDATPCGIRSKPMQVPSPPLPGPFILYNDFAHRLVDLSGDLLLLRFVLQFLPPIRCRIDVFKLDWERSTWVEVESLGNWCLFVDNVGSCATACPEPGRWGGRSNCIYVAWPGCDGWVLVPVDGDRLFTICEPTTTIPLPRWPSPVWVYPSDRAVSENDFPPMERTRG